ncbi:MAG: DUF6796 family protein [Cyclobacteriaceae bacterium]
MKTLARESGNNQKFEIQFNANALKFFSAAGLSASLIVIICNTTLYSFGDLGDWPQWALNLSYWAGSIALAFAGIGFIPTYFALRPAGSFWAVSSSGVLAYFLALGSSGHGSFFAHYSILQAVHNSPGIQELETLVLPIQTYNYFLFFSAIFILFLGSVLYSITVAVRPTLYPRWMALWNPLLIALITIIPGEIEGIPDTVRILSRGIGFHLGLAGHFMLTYYFLRPYFVESSPGSSEK